MRLAGKKDGSSGPSVYVRITSPNPDENAHITLKDTTGAVVRDIIQAALNAKIDRENSEEHTHADAS